MQFFKNPKNQRIISLIKENKASITDILAEFLFNQEQEKDLDNGEKKKKKKEEIDDTHVSSENDTDEDEIGGIDPGAFFE